MILRDTSIRETSIKETAPCAGPNSYFRGSIYNNSGTTTQALPTTLIGAREAYSLAPDYGYGQYGVLRDTGNLPPPSRLASNRFLAAGLDQRILKQSTEDCRRLLQQVGGSFHLYISVDHHY